MKQLKISIIVPIYNSSKYLHKCIESCLNQTLEELEIILVDDASSDSSPILIKEYATKYPDKVVPIYLPENLHQGGARNRGIHAARGEYIAFVDSDDWIEPDMCEQLYVAAKGQNADMAGGNFYISTETEDTPQPLNYRTADLGKMHHKELREYYAGQGYFWNRIYKRTFLLENKLAFPERLFYEDAYFNFMAGLYANKVVKVERAFYHYYQSPNSTIRAKNQPRFYDRIAVVRKLVKDCEKRGLYSEFAEEIQDKILNMSASNILYVCLQNFDEPDIGKVKEIRRDMKKYCPQYKKLRAYKNMDIYLKWYLNQAMRSPSFAIWSYQHGANGFLGYMNAIHYKWKKIKKRDI